MELSKETFEHEVIKSDKPVIVDYWASWCGPCKMIAPVFEKLSQQMPHVKFAKVNVDDHTELAHEQGVMGIPCLIIYKNGEEVTRIPGYQPEEQLKQKINSALSN
ncbi:thioredoxin [Candidatus Woesearchaeota archaeon]|nr:thioredoxin [Candidatus Woesearchaeota archaeon]